jgi:septal ring factor EnvC (AmiA/AmiB activator)
MDNDFAQSLNENQTTNNQTNNENVSPGLQGRIDELTASWRETQRQVAAKDEQIAALMQQMLQQRQQTPALQAEEPVDIDPEDQKKFDYLFRRVTSPLQQKIEELEKQLSRASGVIAGSEVQRLTGDAAVAAEAQKLLNAWANHPVYRNATAEDAVNIAYGKLHREGKLAAGPKGPSINDVALDTPAGGRAAPVSRSSKTVDLNSWDVEDIAANLGSIEQKLADDGFEF